MSYALHECPVNSAQRGAPMQGVLFKYGPASAHIAFKSTTSQLRTASSVTPAAQQRYLVVVGGLTDGLLFAPYCQQLAEIDGWTLVQAQLTSSYQGWGLASLDQDAAELKLLSDCLAAEHGCSSWVLMGHSTGCQDAVRYVQRYRATDPRLAGVILQAPVSDREYLSMQPYWAGHIQAAEVLVQQGKGETVVCRAMEWDGAAVTARRLVSLACEGGDDDMFSTDLSLVQLKEILGPLNGLPTLILQSAADESIPEELKASGCIAQLGQRMVQAIKSGPHADSSDADAGKAASVKGGQSVQAKVQLHVIEGANHACKGHEERLVEVVGNFLEQVSITEVKLDNSF